MGPRGLSQFWSDPTGWVTPEPRLEESSGRGEPSGRAASPTPTPAPSPWPALSDSVTFSRGRSGPGSGWEKMEIGDRGLAGEQFAKTESSQLTQPPWAEEAKHAGGTERALMGGVSQGML